MRDYAYEFWVVINVLGKFINNNKIEQNLVIQLSIVWIGEIK